MIAVNGAAVADPVTAFPALGLWGLGNGLANAPLQAVVAASVPPERVGTATGMVNCLCPVGASLGTSVLGVLFVGAVGRVEIATGGQPEMLGQDIATVFGVVAVAMAVAAVVAGTLVTTPRPVPT